MPKINRRGAIALGAAAGLVAASSIVRSASAQPTPRLRFGVIGLNHGHIYGQCEAVIRGGGDLVAFHADEVDLAATFQARYPKALRVRDERRILDDPSIQLIVSASIPDQRAPLGVRAMRAGKDFMVDKPGVTSIEQLADVRRAQAETGRIYSIAFSERFESRATIRAGALVKAGAIGDVVQTVGLGPHRVNAPSRPEWFWNKARFGGILCDIASHQMDQFLFFTGSTRAVVVASQTGNFHNPDRPDFEDFGDAMVRGDRGAGYMRVDWFTPAALPVWGDGRLTILGSEGYIELRKYIDIGGRGGGDHLFLVNADGVQHVDCSNEPLPYGQRLVDDVLNRTETAMTQSHCFLATQLALEAQAKAMRADVLPSNLSVAGKQQ